MAVWQDQTIRVESQGQVEVAPDETVHLTWVEDGTTFTLIVAQAEFLRLGVEHERVKALAASQ